MSPSASSTAGAVHRVCFQLQVRPERIAEYRERHTAVWPEMLRALQNTGWTNYSLFLREDGLFDAGVYIPAYIRRYPFVFANDATGQQMVLCIDRKAEFIIEGGDMPFFNDKDPSDYTKNCIEFCNNFEIERQRTMSFVQLLKDNDLFESKTANFTPTNPDGTAGEPQKIADYFGISEDKLNALPSEKIIELRDNGALAQIYAHLLSLVGWDRLVAIALARAPQVPDAANG